MSLAKVVEQIKAASVYANENVDEGPIETLNNRRGRKARAIETIKELKGEYVSELMKSSTFILVAGGSKDEFSSIATETYGLFSADVEAFYTDLADRIPESFYTGKESVVNLFDIVGRHLEDKAREIGIIEYPQLRFKSEYRRHIGSKADFVALLKLAVTEQVGGEITGINAIHSITDAAIAKSHTAKVTPVILTSNDEAFSLGLISHLKRLTPNVFLVVSGKSSKTLKAVGDAISVKEPTVESVEQVLNTIKGSLRK